MVLTSTEHWPALLLYNFLLDINGTSCFFSNDSTDWTAPNIVKKHLVTLFNGYHPSQRLKCLYQPGIPQSCNKWRIFWVFQSRSRILFSHVTLGLSLWIFYWTLLSLICTSNISTIKYFNGWILSQVKHSRYFLLVQVTVKNVWLFMVAYLHQH